MSGILAFLQGAAGGAVKGAQMRRDWDQEDEVKKAREEDRAFQREQRERQRQLQREDDELRNNLRAAAAPVALTEGAGGMVRPETMDNRDVGLPENAGQPNDGLMPVAYRVGAQPFADRGAAQAAVQQQNAPEAVNQRVAAAYRAAGQPEKAMQLQSQANAAELQGMQLMDARWRRDLGGAMRGGHAGLAQFATQSEAGPMAGLKVSLIPSADGKTVQYGVAGADGAVAPIPGLPAFSNDERGVTQAAWMLDRAVTPEARMSYYQAQDALQQQRATQAATVARTQANADRDYQLRADNAAETRRHNQASEAAAAARAKTGDAKPLPSSALKMQQEGLDAIGTASSINADLGAMHKQIAEGKLSFGPISNLVNSARNAAGMSNEESRNLSSFRSNLERLRNESLRLNKGVQTDGDAQRAWNELFENLNDTALVQQRLEEIQRLNNRAVELRKLDIDGVRANYGHPPLDTSAYAKQPAAVGQGGPAGRAQAPAAGATVRGEGGKQYRFKGGDPKDRNSWEPVQ
ncbi:hypothetical protein GCM10007320_08570 [Pseudorhodoferax aquiterrae]|uniref:Uncharacterized protein n=1 Tax=Pseudorhodoferax aquiterrae TaxID=747304 RepID=A0ABQ3FX22_9BURK|nr:hypothetical protein [Pseudorhodoferax aquiterrae]GHC72591.1 hypothetical protein GCM10007320_08570 [Pseudorhodoferax aquiterrae]